MKKIIPFFLLILLAVFFVSCDFNLESDGPAPSEDALATMKFAQVLSTTTGLEEGSDATDGLKNSELIQLFLAEVGHIDTSTLELYYQNGDDRYYYYNPSSFSAKPENILYYEITSRTNLDKYIKSGSIVQLKDLSIVVNLAPGKLENGKIVKDGDYFENSSIYLMLNSVKLTMQSDGSFEIELVDSVGNFKSLKMTNETDLGTTVSSFVYTEEGKSKVEEESKMTFCTVTFNPDNGGAKETKQVVYGTAVGEPSTKPLNSKGEDTFSCWKLGSLEYDFNSRVYQDITLTASYVSDFSKIIEAECIYKIATILPAYETLYNKDNQTFSEIFPNNNAADDKNLATILLSSLFKMNDEEKLYVTYDGVDTVYEGNEETLWVSKVTENCTIGENDSSKTSESKTVKLKDFSLKLQFGSKFQTYSQTFSIDETYATADGITVITAKFTVGEKTYPTLTATSKTLENGKTEVDFDYGGYEFTRTY